MSANETITDPNHEPSVQEQAKMFLDGYFSRSPEQIESDYYDLAAANSLLADEQTPPDYQKKAEAVRETMLQKMYPSQDVLRVLKTDLATNLESKILELDAQASVLEQNPAAAHLFRTVVRATMDIGLTLSTGMTYEYADQLAIGGTRRSTESEFSVTSGGGAVGTSKLMQQRALSDWYGVAE